MKLSVSTCWVSKHIVILSNELLTTQSGSLATRTRIDRRSVINVVTAGRLATDQQHTGSSAAHRFRGLGEKNFRIRRTYVAATGVLTDTLTRSEVAHFSQLLYKTLWNVINGEKSTLVLSDHSQIGKHTDSEGSVRKTTI